MGRHLQHDRPGFKKRSIELACIVLAVLTVVSATVVQAIRLQSAPDSFPLRNSSQTNVVEPDPFGVSRTVRLGARRDDLEALLGAPDKVMRTNMSVLLCYNYEIDPNDSDQVGKLVFRINMDNRVATITRAENGKTVAFRY